jgi:hypothetical protein
LDPVAVPQAMDLLATDNRPKKQKINSLQECKKKLGFSAQTHTVS